MLEQLFIPKELQRDPDAEDALIHSWGNAFSYLLGDFSHENVKATENNALMFNTVYACINVLSDDIAKLPIHVYRKENDKIERVTDTGVHKVLRVRPNGFMSPFDWVKLLMTDVGTHGKHFSVINIDDKGEIASLVPLNPSHVIPFISRENGKLYYQTNIDGKTVNLPQEQVIHIKGMTRDGINGLSPISAARVQLESNDIAGKYNKNMIKEGGTPQGVLVAQSSLSPQAKKVLREGWEETNKGRSIAVVDQNVAYQQIGISQSDMQWLESQKYNTQQISAIYKMPLHKINDLDNATYTNIEHQSLDYVKNTLQPWVTKIEQELNYKLFTPSEIEQGYYVKFNMDSELRGDSLARARVNQINLHNGMKTINEVRALNEDSPFEGDFANKAWMTLNVVPAESAEEHQNNKFGQSLRNIQNLINELELEGRSGDDTDDEEGHSTIDS